MISMFLFNISLSVTQEFKINYILWANNDQSKQKHLKLKRISNPIWNIGKLDYESFIPEIEEESKMAYYKNHKPIIDEVIKQSQDKTKYDLSIDIKSYCQLQQYEESMVKEIEYGNSLYKQVDENYFKDGP